MNLGKLLSRSSWHLVAMLLVLMTGILVRAHAQLERPHVAGELLVWAKAGTMTKDDVAAAAKAAGGSLVRPLLMDDVYLLRFTDSKGLAASDAVVGDALTALNQTGKYVKVCPNYMSKWHDVTPNDPRYKEQWHHGVLNMPKAWDIEKGQSNVTVVVMDSGIDVNHPDLNPRLIGFQNFYTPSTPNDVTDNVPHGTHVAGIAAAATDNGIGVAGIAWQNVGLYVAKVGDTTGTPESAVIDAVTYTRKNLTTGKKVVVNMSFGADVSSDTPDVTDPQNAAILAGAKEGIIFTISAGNSYTSGNPASTPANMSQVHPNILCVASVGPTKQHAYYSTARAYTTIAAPGGDQSLGDTNGVLSTLPGTYGYEQGTSMAAPAAAGVVAILLSAGADPSIIRDTLITTANTLNQSVPNALYGYGLIDAYAAVLKVAVNVTITSPDGVGGKASTGVISKTPDPIETLVPTITAQVGQVTPSNLVVQLNNKTITDYTIQNVLQTTTDATGATVPLRYTVVIKKELPIGQNTVTLTGTKSGTTPLTVSDTRTFTITPHQVPQGRSILSIPYFQDTNGNGVNSATPELYFGNDFRLARYLPDQQRYVFYTATGPKDAEASFNPPSVVPVTDGTTAAKYPLGLAWWNDSESVRAVITRGQPITGTSVVIPLKGNGSGDSRYVSWNMVGDPFIFDVPFNTLLVDTPEGRLSISDAVTKGYLIPNIYTYDGTNGYTYRTLPDGALRSWTGHWIGVTSKQNIALVIPPAQTSRAATTPLSGPNVGSNGWALRLGASVGTIHDTYNFIGQSTRAADTYDQNKVAKPPMPSDYVSVGVDNANWGRQSGLYAQDIRSTSGTKTWNVVVSTDQANKDVVFNWSANGTLPRTQRLTIKDETSGQVYDMRTRSSLTFNSGSNAAARRFTVTARTGTGDLVRISNVVVRSNGSRSGGTSTIGFTLTGDATYEVQVVGLDGRAVNKVASRAAAAGDVSVIWNGRDANGRAVNAGTYLVQIRAFGTDGDQVKVIQPFVIVR